MYNFYKLTLTDLSIKWINTTTFVLHDHHLLIKCIKAIHTYISMIMKMDIWGSQIFKFPEPDMVLICRLGNTLETFTTLYSSWRMGTYPLNIIDALMSADAPRDDIGSSLGVRVDTCSVISQYSSIYCLSFRTLKDSTMFRRILTWNHIHVYIYRIFNVSSVKLLTFS